MQAEGGRCLPRLSPPVNENNLCNKIKGRFPTAAHAAAPLRASIRVAPGAFGCWAELPPAARSSCSAAPSHSTITASVHGCPNGAPGPDTQPRWPPQGVTASRQLGLARMASKGMASAGAMGSSSAWMHSSGMRTSGMDRELLDPA